jgi:type IV pilus assembly protein PilA
MTRIRQRLAREDGFTLIELLVVIVIIGILLAIAVPSYLGFRARAQDSAAAANLRAAVPSAEAFYSENGSYVGMTVAGLKTTYDNGLKTTGSHAVSDNATAPTASAYCLQATGRPGKIYYFSGPGGEVTSPAAPPAGCS